MFEMRRSFFLRILENSPIVLNAHKDIMEGAPKVNNRCVYVLGASTSEEV